MKNSRQLLLALTIFTVTAQSARAATNSQPATPTVDPQGHFWVYRNGPTQPRMPFTPYGWMSDVTNRLTQLIRVDLECRDRPNTAFKPARPQEKDSCIQIKLNWDTSSWAGVAFISGPDKPPWWGESSRGKYFNLSGLPKKKLVFYARGERGGETIKVQMGVLAGRPFGDSLSKPFLSDEFKLTQEWTKQEVDLSEIPKTELAKICNGFGVVADQADQPGPGTETQFYIDDVYFE